MKDNLASLATSLLVAGLIFLFRPGHISDSYLLHLNNSQLLRSK